LKKSPLSVKNVAAPAASKIHGPHAFDAPISGFNDQRLVPMLTRRVGSYWLAGAVTRTLPPMMRSWR